MQNYFPVALILSSFPTLSSGQRGGILIRDTIEAYGFAIHSTGCTSSQSLCYSTGAGFDVCCPSSLNCFGDASNERCCPTDDCVTELEASPRCVDTSWTLCGGPSLYLCCDAGTTCYSTTVDGKSEVGCLAAGGSLGVGEISVGLVLPSSTSKTSVTAAPSTTQTSRLASSNTVRTTTTGDDSPTSTPTVFSPTVTPSSSNGGGGGGQNTVQTVCAVIGTFAGVATLALAIYDFRTRKVRRFLGFDHQNTVAGEWYRNSSHHVRHLNGIDQFGNRGVELERRTRNSCNDGGLRGPPAYYGH